MCGQGSVAAAKAFSLSRSQPEAEPRRYSAKLGTSYWPAMQALAEPASRL